MAVATKLEFSRANVLAFVRERAPQEDWKKASEVYPTLRDAFGEKENTRFYNLAGDIGKAMLAGRRAPSNGAVVHAQPENVKKPRGKSRRSVVEIDPALTMAQQQIDRDDRYIAILEAIVEVKDPEAARALRVVRAALR